MKVIEVYADVWCPFAHVGLRCVVARRAELGREDVALRVRAWPLELVNGAPLDPVSTAEHVRDLRAQVAPELFSHFDPDHFPRTSLPALASVRAAYRKDIRLGEAVSLALRDALFEQGLDISRPHVLADVTRAYGIGPADEEDVRAVLDEWHHGQLRGVKGSPHFFCGDTEAFCPSLDISKAETGELHVSGNMEVLDALLAKCFETD